MENGQERNKWLPFGNILKCRAKTDPYVHCAVSHVCKWRLCVVEKKKCTFNMTNRIQHCTNKNNLIIKKKKKLSAFLLH